ncbi:MAG: sensor histidine kinase [Fimbriimonadaceae bacterium]
MKRFELGLLPGFVGVVGLLAGTVFALLAPGNAFMPWLLVGFGALAVWATTSAIALERERQDKLMQRKSQIDLLQVQLSEQQSAEDVLADGLDVALFICDLRAGIQFANRRAVDMFRVSGPVGRSILAATLSPDLERLVIDVGQLQEARQAELVFKFPEERVGLAKAWPHRDGRRIFLSIYETTELRRLERIRQDFVANVSHEFRTPMTIIRAMAETLLDSPEEFPVKGEDYLGRMIAEVDRLSLISNDLLILSSAESYIVRKHATNIARLCRATVQSLEPKAAEKDLTLTYAGAQEAFIEANETQLTQVLMNLIENAINYTPSGNVWVELVVGEGEVSIRVRDTGIGIASDQAPRIFERFYRVDKARSRSTGGTGLGLSIVKHIVEAHGGTVRLESALNSGSTFTVTLPVGEVGFAGA